MSSCCFIILSVKNPFLSEFHKFLHNSIQFLSDCILQKLRAMTGLPYDGNFEPPRKSFGVVEHVFRARIRETFVKRESDIEIFPKVSFDQ